MAIAEGKSFQFDGPEKIRTDYLETFEFLSTEQYIKTVTNEFSAVCPFSGLPDYGDLIIEYRPQGKCCVELKSLKYYIVSFRNVGLYQEGVTKRIYDDLKALLKTDALQVTTLYMPRGGFVTTSVEGSIERPDHD